MITCFEFSIGKRQYFKLFLDLRFVLRVRNHMRSNFKVLELKFVSLFFHLFLMYLIFVLKRHRQRDSGPF